MIPTASRLERAATWALAVFGLTLPLEGIGAWSPRAAIGMQICDLVVVVASPLLLAFLWRVRSNLARDPLLWACAGLATAAIGSDALRGSGSTTTLAGAAKQGVMLLTVCSLAAAGIAGRSKRLVIAVSVGGGMAVVVSLIGYLWVVLFANPATDDLPFALQTTHPVFAGLPRLTGTFGNSPQEMGELTVVFLAALWTTSLDQPRRFLIRAGLAVGCVALLITFSSAWVAGLVLAAGLAIARWPGRPTRTLAPVAVAVAVIVTFVAMNFGPPTGRPTWARLRAFPCDTGETEHFVTWSVDARANTCRQIPMTWPYRSVLTTYWQAKKTAWGAITAAPLVGHGRNGYSTYATEAFRRLSGGRVLGVFYDRPHCTPLEVVTAFGAPGGFALALLLYTILRRRPTEWTAPAMPLWLGVIGLLLVGLNIDLLERRPFWALVGLLAAASASARSAGREDLPEVLDRAPDAVVESDPGLPAK